MGASFCLLIQYEGNWLGCDLAKLVGAVHQEAGKAVVKGGANGAVSIAKVQFVGSQQELIVADQRI